MCRSGLPEVGLVSLTDSPHVCPLLSPQLLTLLRYVFHLPLTYLSLQTGESQIILEGLIISDRLGDTGHGQQSVTLLRYGDCVTCHSTV